MSHDPTSFSPSDSGLLDGPLLPPHVSGGRSLPSDMSSNTADRSELPDPPKPAPVNAEQPEESLRNVPLPEGLMGRLQRFVDDL